MNDVLLDAFRHHAWATTELIGACRALSAEQLVAPGTATYGSILDTFNHFITSDASYLRSLSGLEVDWNHDQAAGLDLLETRAKEVAALWERFLSEPFDPEKMLFFDDGYEAHAGVLVAQVLHHGNAHREQICAILTGYGIEPPDVQPWGYSEATGRGRWRST
jgi:uncharacterized damage-inducible protein DinB